MEDRLRKAILSGQPVDLRTDGDKGPPAARERDPSRTLRAVLLADLLGRDDWPHRPRGLLLGGVRITGLLDLSDLKVPCPVTLLDCRFVDGVVATNTSIPLLRINRCHLPALDAAQLSVLGDLSVGNTTVDGPVSLPRAQVGGDLLGSGLRAGGGVELSGAQVAGRLDLRGAKLCNRAGTGLSADGLRVGHHMQCTKLHVEGATWLMGARVDGNLELAGATLIRRQKEPPKSIEDDAALFADHLVVQQDAHLGPEFRTRGAISLRHAKIGGTLEVNRARLGPRGRGAVHFEQLQVHTLDWRDLTGRPKELYLLDARVSVLIDRPRSWPPTVYLRGCTYDHLLEEPEIDVGERLAWLRRDAYGFQPQAYEQLAAVYRRAGRNQDARIVAIAKHRARRAKLSPPGKVLSVLSDALVGYGYRTWLAGVWLLLLVVVGWVLFDLAHPAHLVAPLPPGQRPSFHAGLYALDLLLPIGDLNYQGAWIARGWARGLWLGWILAGWVLTTAVLAALAGSLRRDCPAAT